MKVAVTGSSGFIGSRLVRHLNSSGVETLEISRKKGLDICDWSTVKRLEACDVIIHLAAKTFVPDSFENPREFYYINQTASLNVMELARKWNARVIYMSSYFYGPPQYLPVDEDHPLHPHNPYAQTKLISELLCKGYQRDFDIPMTIFRLFNIYGPGQDGEFLIPTIMKQVKSGEVILKDHRPKRDYIHIDDVIRAITCAIEQIENGLHIFNLGTGKSYSVKELTNIVKSLAKPSLKVTFTNEYRKGEVINSVADISFIKKKLDWKPEISLEEGIKTLFTL